MSDEEYDSYFELLRLMVKPQGGENMEEKIVYDPTVEKQGIKLKKAEMEKQKKAEKEKAEKEAKEKAKAEEKAKKEAEKAAEEKAEKEKKEAEKEAQKAKKEAEKKAQKAEKEKEQMEKSRIRHIIMSHGTPLISLPPDIKEKAGLDRGVDVTVDWDEEQQMITAKVVKKP